MIAIGGGLAAIVAGLAAGPLGIVAYAVRLMVLVPIGFAVYWILGILWFGFDAPLHVIILRLAAIYAVTDGVLILFSHLTFLGPLSFIIGGLAGILTYVGLHMELLELEIGEAILMAALTFIIRLAITFVLAALLV